jgi:hypothetical protein
MSADDWPARPAWHALADLFFPAVGDDPHHSFNSSAYDAARTICASCPVTTECAEAGRSEHTGMWGGKTPAERSKRRRRPAA